MKTIAIANCERSLNSDYLYIYIGVKFLSVFEFLIKSNDNF